MRYNCYHIKALSNISYKLLYDGNMKTWGENIVWWCRWNFSVVCISERIWWPHSKSPQTKFILRRNSTTTMYYEFYMLSFHDGSLQKQHLYCKHFRYLQIIYRWHLIRICWYTIHFHSIWGMYYFWPNVLIPIVYVYTKWNAPVTSCKHI